MENELRELLRRKAGEVQAGPQIPTGVIQRARRQRIGTALVAGVVAAALGFGGFVGVRAAIDAVGLGEREVPGEEDEGPITGTEDVVTVSVFFNDSDTNPKSVRAVPREIPASEDPLTGALEALLEGPTEDERADGLSSFFSSETAGLLERTDGAAGTTYVVFSARLPEVIPNASTSFGGAALIASLNATVFQFEEIQQVTYTLEDDCQAFWEWLQRQCEVQTREGAGDQTPPEPLSETTTRTRDQILDAAVAFDWDALAALIDEATFSYSFGESGDPIGYWQRLESEGHVPVIGDILRVILLDTSYAKSGDTYVWPAAAAKDPSQWTEQDREDMRKVHNEEEIRSFEDGGAYLGWRVGIHEDGTWLYYISGD